MSVDGAIDTFHFVYWHCSIRQSSKFVFAANKGNESQMKSFFATYFRSFVFMVNICEQAIKLFQMYVG